MSQEPMFNQFMTEQVAAQFKPKEESITILY